MGVASLVLGILGITVFCWLGPLLGGFWAGALMAGTVIDGQPQIIAWPVWALGLGVGVFPSVLAVLLGIGTLVKGRQQGVGIGGIVTGLVSAVIAFVITFFAVKGLEIADELTDPDKVNIQQQLQQVTDDLNDPLTQKKFQDRLQKAAGNQPGQMEPKPMQLQPEEPKPAGEPPAQPAQPPSNPQP